MSQLGSFLLLLAFFVSLGLLTLSFNASLSRRGREFIEGAAYTGLLLLFLAVTAASVVLLVALWQHDFSIEYIANYTSRDLPSFYTVTAFWAGQEGSLLLWAWLISFFGVIFYSRYRGHQLASWALTVVLTVESYFLLLLVLPANPFKLLVDPVTGRPFTPADGQGLNPLLQNIGMVFHPPTIFLGFAAFTIPFALAMAALLSPKVDDEWIELSRRWALLAWLFLGIGNVLGAWWAYVELGWGGYWAWDPVENASLFPWLTGAAFIHSLGVYQKRQTLKLWSFFLIILTFFLCVFGTYLTRSGVLQTSVHSFDRSLIGIYLLVFLAVAIPLAFFVLFRRYKEVVGKSISNYLSREGSFALNNWLFSLFTFVVLWGTLLPIITGVIQGQQREVGRAYFDRFTTPLIYLIVLLLSFCFYLVWEKFELSQLLIKLKLPLVAALPLAIGFALAFPRSPIGWLGFFIGSFAFTSTLYRVFADVKQRVEVAKQSWGVALLYLFRRDRRRYGGLIAHVGVAVLFLGIIASTVYRGEKQAKLRMGEEMRVADVVLRYEQPVQEAGANYEAVGVELTLFENNSSRGKLYPMMAYYPRPGSQTSEVAVKWGFWRDVYVAISQLDEQAQATLVVNIEPMVSWIWLGSCLLFLGIIWAWWPERE